MPRNGPMPTGTTTQRLSVRIRSTAVTTIAVTTPDSTPMLRPARIRTAFSPSGAVSAPSAWPSRSSDFNLAFRTPPLTTTRCHSERRSSHLRPANA